MNSTVNAHNRYTAGRFLQSLAVARGRPDAAAAYAAGQNWHDAAQIRLAATAAYDDSDFPTTLTPIADAFLGAMRQFSIPMQLAGLRRVPMRTRVFVSAGSVAGYERGEGVAVPVLRSTWAEQTLLPRSFDAMAVVTQEAARSPDPAAALAIQDELAERVAGAENYAFLSPSATGSVLNAATNFAGTGSAIANVAADLLLLASIVPGAARGGVYVMHPRTATFLGLLVGSGGGVPFPGLGPSGGTLNGLPVLTDPACELLGSPTGRVICLLSPREIMYADQGRVRLSVSTEAAIEMLDEPTNISTGSTAAAQLVSMYQTDSVAVLASRESNWHARSGSAGYFTTSF
jgi:HK97 family phage major capsid protein